MIWRSVAGFSWDVHVAKLSSRVIRSSWSTSVDSRIHSFFCPGNQVAKAKLLGSVIGTLLKNSVPPKKTNPSKQKSTTSVNKKPFLYKTHKRIQGCCLSCSTKTWRSCWIQRPRNCTCFQQLLQCLHSTWVRLQTFIETWLRVWKDLERCLWNWCFMMLHDQYYGHFIMNKWSMDLRCPNAVGAFYRQMWNNI